MKVMFSLKIIFSSENHVNQKYRLLISLRKSIQLHYKRGWVPKVRGEKYLFVTSGIGNPVTQEMGQSARPKQVNGPRNKLSFKRSDKSSMYDSVVKELGILYVYYNARNFNHWSSQLYLLRNHTKYVQYSLLILTRTLYLTEENI